MTDPPAVDVLNLLGGARKQPSAPALLVVGAHREERAFGEAVAARLPGAGFDVLRIERGLSGRRPGPEALDAYRRRHRALYEQILGHIRPTHHVVLDLHTGFDESGLCAEVLSADPLLLGCIERAGSAGVAPALGVSRLRGVQLVAECPLDGRPDATAGTCAPRAGWPRLKPDIPAAVWHVEHPLYIGVEIYLPGAPGTAGIEFGAAVVTAAARCGLNLMATREHTAVR
ncbi:hypothetical protein [Thiohalocapsa sp. ML1]|uniref:hypothetical protein n=1 Tax=Thiohalocapsa sp. ML1 TaxID=1431688 RepID=UPI000B169B98|nr:hypothetical protein [Thiohalocapsa sp. ML1]